MQRTYRSKKDVAGGLDHRDILNFNDKSSVFDAYYIQNLKQTKRELSCVSSNQYVVASKKIRKRKYTKRIVKDFEPISKDSSAPSAYLTPDKSIRVNKVLDPFDALLNSSPITQVDKESNKNELFHKLQPKREHKIYTKKNRNKPKNNNYSSSSSDSDKENSGELSNASHNKTDIRKYKLLVEKEHIASSHFADESINNVVQNISELHHFKNNDDNDSFMKFSLTGHRLTDNIQSPILQNSPLCSTPFKQKYRGQSIYKFSPILKNYHNSPSVNLIPEASIVNDNSVVFIEENNESNHEIHKSPIIHTSIDNVQLRETSQLALPVKQVSSDVHLFNLHSTENKEGDLLNNSEQYTCIEVSSLHTTEAEPFLGFTKNIKNDFICAIEDNEGSYDKGIVKILDMNKVYETKSLEISPMSKKIVHELINDNMTIFQNNKSKIECNDSNNKSQHSIKLNMSDPDEEEDDIDCIHLERQTLYNTCTSESLQEIDRTVVKVPIVRLERMNDSIFVKYKKKMFVVTQNNITSNSLTDEDSDEFKSFQERTSVSDDSHSSETDNVTSSMKESSKSSISENAENSSSDELIKSSDDEERCISFVTTRRKNELTNNSTLSNFENSSYNNSTEFDKTVLNNMSDTKIACFNVNKANAEDSVNINSNEKTYDSILLSTKQNRISTNKISIDFISTNSDISNYNDKDSSTDDTSLYAIAADTQVSHNYIKYSERKQFSRKRSTKLSEINRIVELQSTTTTDSENTGHYNNRKMNNEPIELVSSDSAPEKPNNVSPIIDRSILLSKRNKASRVPVVLNKTAKTDSLDTDNDNNDLSLHLIPPNVLDSDDTDSNHSEVNISCVTSKSKRITRKYTKMRGKKSNVEQIDVEIKNNEDMLNSNEATVHATLSYKLKENIDTDPINSIDVMNNKSSRITSMESSNFVRRTSLEKNPEAAQFTVTEVKPSIVLEPGKKWERSLSIYRRMTMMNDNLNQSILDEPLHMKGRKYRQSVMSTLEMQDIRGSLHNESINSRRSTFVSKPSRSTIKIVKDPNITRLSLYTTAVYDDLKGFLSDDCDDTIVDLSKLSIADAEPEVTVLEVHDTSNRLATARDYVLRRCNQTDAILFDECYPDTVLKNCHKIGEGVYGEVFLWRDRDGRARVMKIVPIAGHVKVNGETQKDFHEIISEIVIAMELSALRAPIAKIERNIDEGKIELDLHAIENATDVFNEVLAVRCVYGSYPSRLLDLWDLYDECKGSENDNPAILPVDQQYLVLELANAGLDLESYQFNNAEQAHALFLQVAFGLAVGEEAFQFEHRDLHWGNVLIAPTEQKFATFVLRGREHRVSRCGVSGTIIDYSLSRISLPLGPPAECAALYNDLATDDGLFDAVGDYQFEVYRLMRDKLGNVWKNFEPYTNIVWLHYTVDKMITALRYKRTNTKIHKHYIDKLKGIKNRILDYKSAVEFVLTDNEF